MFVPIIARSDKTTVSVTTGHQKYHPIYISLGNLTNIAQHACGNALLPVTFLPILKSKSLVYDKLIASLTPLIISHQETLEESHISSFLPPNVPHLLGPSFSATEGRHDHPRSC
jgi:Plavaka transposase